MSIDRNEPVQVTIRGCADDPRVPAPDPAGSWSIASRPFIPTT